MRLIGICEEYCRYIVFRCQLVGRSSIARTLPKFLSHAIILDKLNTMCVLIEWFLTLITFMCALNKINYFTLLNSIINLDAYYLPKLLLIHEQRLFLRFAKSRKVVFASIKHCKNTQGNFRISHGIMRSIDLVVKDYLGGLEHSLVVYYITCSIFLGYLLHEPKNNQLLDARFHCLSHSFNICTPLLRFVDKPSETLSKF